MPFPAVSSQAQSPLSSAPSLVSHPKRPCGTIGCWTLLRLSDSADPGHCISRSQVIRMLQGPHFELEAWARLRGGQWAGHVTSQDCLGLSKAIAGSRPPSLLHHVTPFWAESLPRCTHVGLPPMLLHFAGVCTSQPPLLGCTQFPKGSNASKLISDPWWANALSRIMWFPRQPGPLKAPSSQWTVTVPLGCQGPPCVSHPQPTFLSLPLS